MAIMFVATVYAAGTEINLRICLSLHLLNRHQSHSIHTNQFNFVLHSQIPVRCGDKECKPEQMCAGMPDRSPVCVQKRI